MNVKFPEWLGPVPGHWAIARLASFYEVQLGKMLNEEAAKGHHLAPYLRNVDVQWDYVNVRDLPEMDFQEQQRRKFSLRYGDVLVCEGGEVGRTALWRDELPVCFYQKAIHRLRPRSIDQKPRFLFYVLRAACERGAFVAEGNRSTIVHLTAEKLRAHRFPFPPPGEQSSIANLLDRKTATIDDLIRKKERLIELLQEKRQALITQAVTKGLDPSVPMKDSGVDWIGLFPSHWDIARTRQVARLESGHTPSRQHPEWWISEECTLPWVSLADVWQLRDGLSEYIDETAEKISPAGLANSSARRLPAGTVILSRTASVGFSGILKREMATTQDFVNWVCGPRLISEYLLYFLRAMAPEFDRLTQGSVHRTIYMPDVAQFVTTLPPPAEQRAIVDRIRGELQGLDGVVRRLREQRDLLREYRQALITAAVTGQLDIPAEAA